MSELIYTIDALSSERENILAIKIQEAQRQGFDLQPIEQQKPLTRSYLVSLQTAKDSALLAFLIQAETAYRKKSGHSETVCFDRIHLSPSDVPQALKLFALSNRLYFQGKALAIDLFGKTELYYRFSEGGLAAYVKAGSQEFPLTACNFIGKSSPPFYIKDIQLKFISTDISWKDVKAAYEGVIRPIEELLKESADDPAAPRVLHDAAQTVSLIKDPLPVFILQDRSGAFGSLWMDYGDHNNLIPFHSHLEPNRGPLRHAKQIEAEKGWEKDLLETNYIKKQVGSSHYYCPLDKVAKSLAFLLEIGWQVRDWKGNCVHQQSGVELAAEDNGEQIAIKGALHYDSFKADLSSIVGAFNRRERFVELAPGHTALLPDQWDKIGLENICEESVVLGDTVCVKRQHIGTLASFFEKNPHLELGQKLKLLKEGLTSFDGIAEAAAGTAFCGVLRPYQQEGLNWMSFLHDYHFNGILADDMGLGKTVQVLAFLSRLPLDTPSLVVVPTSLIFNWKKECERFLPSYRVAIHHGNQRNRTGDLKGAQIILTTYTTLRLDFPLLSQMNYSCLILDEAQAIKNAATQTFQAVIQLRARFRLSMTGTPIENSLSELWSHFHFLLPDLLGEETAFQADIQAGMSDPRFLQRIKKKIRPFLLRRRKEQVARDLPEKIEQVVWVEMGDEQRQAYETFLSGVRQGVLKKVTAEGVGAHRLEILEAIMRLRQICCHPWLVSEQADSSKLEALLQDVETAIAENGKILIYSQFTSMLTLISRRIQERGWRYVYLDGSTRDREKVVTQFQEDPQIPLFLISLKAGGIGLNLTSADYVFLYDPWWNAAVENQAIDRAHRIGRKETVVAKRYVMVESIEEKMMKLKAAKSALSSELLDEDSLAQKLTIDDLLFLLS